MNAEITFLDLSIGRERSGQYWSDAPLVTGRHAVWVIAHDTGRPVHVHKVAARHRDTRAALDRPREAWPAVEWITGVSTPYGTRHDLTRPEWPRKLGDGRTVCACCVSSIGPACQHRATHNAREGGTMARRMTYTDVDGTTVDEPIVTWQELQAEAEEAGAEV